MDVTKVKCCLQTLGVQNNAGIVVALSGGADSMALLYALAALRETDGIRLVAAHVHHGLREQEAYRDAVFVREQCDALHIPCETLFAHVAEEKLSGESIEQAGRRIRYAFFETVREKHHLQYVATAHHADDNLETVLLHLTRGSGLHGLCGIPAKNGCCIRPLLPFSRAEIEQFCTKKHIPFVVDSTNTDILYSRNRVRNAVIPQLREINPQVTEACTRLTANLREEDAFLENLTDTYLQKAVNGGKYRRDVLAAIPPVLQKRAVKRIAEQAGGDPEEKHILALTDMVTHGGAVDLPGNVRMVADATYVFADTEKTVEETPEQPLAIGDAVKMGDTVYTACCISVEEFKKRQNVHKNVLKFCCDYDKIVGSTVVRSRNAGDKFHPVGGVGKTLKKFFNENAVLPQLRAGIPIVCDEKGIVLIAGFSCDDRVKLDKKTKRVFLLWGGQENAIT